MSLSEIEFAFFLPFALLVYWLVPRRAPVQNLILLATSYVFYATWDWRFLGLIVSGTLVDFFAMSTMRDARDDSPGTRRNALLTSLLFSLGALAYFKYANFFSTAVVEFLSAIGLRASTTTLDVLLPLGISFFTLQRVGLVLDVYWRRQSAPASLLEFANFCCFFPQLAAGPIARGSELLTQLNAPRTLTPSALRNAASAIFVGFALKAWAADSIGAAWVAPVFSNPDAWGWIAHWFAVVGFTLQVFGDFAGYSLMAIGVARLFGLELPANFNFPLLSTSLPDLWRRWHITLNRWLFDYVFTPMTTSRGFFRGRVNLALIATFLISGLWHGAAWTFVLWGLLHGVGMVIHQAWDAFYRGLCRKDRGFVRVRQTLWYALASWALTMGFFVLTMIPFRAGSLEGAWVTARSMLGHDGMWPALEGLTSVSALLGALFIVLYHLASLDLFARVRSGFAASSPVFRGIVYGAAAAFLVVFAPVGSGSFIYQQF